MPQACYSRGGVRDCLARRSRCVSGPIRGLKGMERADEPQKAWVEPPQVAPAVAQDSGQSWPGRAFFLRKSRKMRRGRI